MHTTYVSTLKHQMYLFLKFQATNYIAILPTKITAVQNGGGPTPFLPMEKCVFSHFFPWGKMGKKYMEREVNEYFLLSFHILFFPFFPMGKNGKTHIFPWEKMGLDPPPPNEVAFSYYSYCYGQLFLRRL